MAEPEKPNEAEIVAGGLRDFGNFVRTKAKDRRDDRNFEFIEGVLSFGLHIILWRIVQGLLLVFVTYVLFRRVTLEYLLYTVVLGFLIKKLSEIVFGK